MKTFRRVLWAAVVIICAMIAWLVYEIGRTNEKMMNVPFGPKFALTDSNGAEITEAAFREKPTLLFFGFTHCPEVCPTTLYELNGLLHEVDPDGDKFDAYWITVDPERDTPEIMHRYLSNVTDRIVGVSGDPEKVLKMVDGFGIYYEKVPLDPNDPDGDYTMNHNAAVFMLDDGGVLDGTIAYDEDPEVARKKLENLLKG
ncbi:SCO family protein [Martelella endophytica]|uniref:Copper chaperone n=1 Tax=Martelella endophytica TaxID=1486262 RepID=A0A0D5LXY6_MAREN|nr:SCO family protein [Martelella endophytica]AJY48333.1 copper chaperone [Martelella endophytica]